MRRSLLGLIAGLALGGAMGACGKAGPQSLQQVGPALGAAARPGAIAVVTKNTTRLGGVDAATDAATDAGTDASADASTDAGADSATDAAVTDSSTADAADAGTD